MDAVGPETIYTEATAIDHARKAHGPDAVVRADAVEGDGGPRWTVLVWDDAAAADRGAASAAGRYDLKRAETA